MDRPDAERVARTSPDLVRQRMQALRDLFPEAFSEGKVDFDKLRAALGDLVDESPERYSFTWAGKRDSVTAFQRPSRGTLATDKDASVNWDGTSHVFIEGENLEVLKLLYRSYFGRVKMIYIDPPYNTGIDRIYPDDFADPLGRYLRATGQMDDAGNLLTTNADTGGRYHSAWLSMLYPRLFLARQLLRDDGVIFVSIDDSEVDNLRLLMNEVFGEENRIESFVWKKSYGGGAKEKYAVTQHEYVLLYARNLPAVGELWLPPDPDAEARYYKFRDGKFAERGPYRVKPLEASKSMDRRGNLTFPVPLPWGGEVLPKRQWWWSADRVMRTLANDELVFTQTADGVSVSYKQYLRDENGVPRGAKPFSVIDGIYTQQGTADLSDLFDGRVVMQFPKPVALMRQLVSMATEEDREGVVLDFFAGSCPLAQAVLGLNREDNGDRRFVVVQLPEPLDEPITLRDGTTLATIADIGRQRIRRVIARMRAEDEGKLDIADRETPEDLGFRALRLVRSNLRSEEDAAADGETEEVLFTQPLVDGWTADGLLHEIGLREGFDLAVRIERLPDLTTNTIYRITDPHKDQMCHVCLDPKLDAETAKVLGLTRDDLFICFDSALDDTLAANLALQCHLKVI